jgi:hypothetical protein
LTATPVTRSICRLYSADEDQTSYCAPVRAMMGIGTPTPIVTPVLRTISKQAGPNPNGLMGSDRVARSQEPGRIVAACRCRCRCSAATADGRWPWTGLACRWRRQCLSRGTQVRWSLASPPDPDTGCTPVSSTNACSANFMMRGFPVSHPLLANLDGPRNRRSGRVAFDRTFSPEHDGSVWRQLADD